VPFELGRPLGAPNDAAFQRRVLDAAFALFAARTTPVIADFPEDAPASARDATGDDGDGEGWVCPIAFPGAAEDPADDAVALAREVTDLAAWYDLALRKGGRTTVGSSGLGMPEAAAFVSTFLDGSVPESPVAGERADRVLKWACDDLRAYYGEAVLAQPGSPSSADIEDWFWGETAAGRVILRVQKALVESGDERLELVGKQYLVPRAQTHRMLTG
jgi:hypothetical protein